MGRSIDTLVRGRDQYGVAVLLLIGTMVLMGLTGGQRWGPMIALAFQGVTLLFILQTSAVGRRVLRLSAIVVAVAVVSSAAVSASGLAQANFAWLMVGALLILLAPVALVRRLLGHDRITVDTVFGALCLYLLAGLFFAHVFGAMDRVGPDFFAQTSDPKSLDFLYFSFVTLATLGYGDLTPVSDLGRMVAVAEALLGQLYLVSVVALLVSNIGRAGARRRASADEAGDPLEGEGPQG